jgi:tetratricopeptide (TPR) repeat protein
MTRALALALALAFALLAGVVAHAAPGGALLDQTMQALELGQLERTVELAQKLAQQQPERFEGYYYLGLALYKQSKLDGAAAALREALPRAPETKQPLIAQLVVIIGDKRIFLAHMHSANVLVAKGALREAGREYEEAWTLFPMRDDVGLAAGLAYREARDAPDAVRVLEQLAASARDVRTSQRSRALLAELRPAADRDQIHAVNEDYKKVAP